MKKKYLYFLTIIFLSGTILLCFKSISSFSNKSIVKAGENSYNNSTIYAKRVKKLEYKFDPDKKFNSNELYRKEVFLTFDDGPSLNTEKVIEILNKNDVKGTFFIIGKMAKQNPEFVKELYDNGMSIEPHTYSHEYDEIYKSTEAYFNDLKEVQDILTGITGKKNFQYVRLPGGSDNRVSDEATLRKIRNEIVEKGLGYVDWNVSSCDSAPGKIPSEIIKKNILGQCSERNFCVVLMHDAGDKKTTMEALPDVIEGLKEQGFVFRTFDDLNAKETEKMININIMDRGYKNKKTD